MGYKEFPTDKTEIESYWEKATKAIKAIFLFPILYIDKLIIILIVFGAIGFAIWREWLIIRAILKYIGE